jgi:RNA polymerase sigma-70 factor (ECF subfamily)
MAERIGKLLPLRRVAGETTALSDEALLAACSLRDPAALAVLVDRYQAPLRRFIARLRGTDGDADDLTQETFVEIARAAASYRGTSPVRTWIFGIAANLVRNDLRAMTRRRGRETTWAALPSAPPRPDEVFEGRERLRRLAAALAALPHAQREAFVLCDLEELACKEAARIAGVREGTIWRRLHDARAALEAAMRSEP